MLKLSLVIPCYNEARNIPLILEKFADVIHRDDIEIILVNNGSLDGSENVLQSLIPKFPFARTIKVDVNQGYGFGILSGLKEARGEFIGWTHADMQTDPHDVIKALEIIEQSNHGNLYVKGRRRNRPLFDNIFTVGMSVFESLYLKEQLYDINAQPNIFPRSFYESWNNCPHDFSLDLFALYMARKSNLDIIRFNVLFRSGYMVNQVGILGSRRNGNLLKEPLILVKN